MRELSSGRARMQLFREVSPPLERVAMWSMLPPPGDRLRHYHGGHGNGASSVLCES
jgi:hypothetical protein